MKDLFALAIICFTVTFSLHSRAQERDFAEIYTDCGIGGLIFQKEKYEWAAVISNIIWDLGTTASSSQITSPETCKGGQPTTAALIYQAYPVVERELSEGRGDYVSAIMDLSGCATEARPAVVDALRAEMSTWVSSDQYAEADRFGKAEFLHNQLSKQVNANSSCAFI